MEYFSLCMQLLLPAAGSIVDELSAIYRGYLSVFADDPIKLVHRWSPVFRPVVLTPANGRRILPVLVQAHFTCGAGGAFFALHRLERPVTCPVVGLSPYYENSLLRQEAGDGGVIGAIEINGAAHDDLPIAIDPAFKPD